MTTLAEVSYPALPFANKRFVVRQGDEAELLYQVKSGAFKGIIEGTLEPTITEVYLPGNYFGALTPGGRHEETVEALCDSEVIPIDSRYALNSLEHLKRISVALDARRKRQTKRMTHGSLVVPCRLAQTLLDLSERLDPTCDVVTFPFELTHEELAGLTNSSRVTVTRFFGDFRDLGAIDTTLGLTVYKGKLEEVFEHYLFEYDPNDS
jgi:CRP/FNR family transcriptional regulator, cyclic AMP receptor protein